MTVLMLHNTCTAYRYPIFSLLQERVDVKFVFTDKGYGGSKGHLKDVISLSSVKIPKMQYEVVPELWATLDKIKPELIITTDATYYMSHTVNRWARKSGVPYILWEEQWRSNWHPRHVVMRRFETRTIRDAAAILALGTKAREYVISRGAHPSKIITAFNTCPSVQPATEEEVRDVRAQFESQKSPLVLFLGRVERIKGIHTLLRAAQLLQQDGSPTKIVIAGTGGASRHSRALAEKLGLTNVAFENRHIDEIRRSMLMSAADAVVLPSQRWWATEAWGLVLNEALSLGKFIICSDETGAAYDLVQNKLDGCVFRAGSAESLAQAMKEISANLGDFENMRSYRYHRKFSLNQLVDGLVQSIESVAHS